MNYGQRICGNPDCGKVFEAQYASHVCCSRECQQKMGKIKKNAWRVRHRIRFDDLEWLNNQFENLKLSFRYRISEINQLSKELEAKDCQIDELEWLIRQKGDAAGAECIRRQSADGGSWKRKRPDENGCGKNLRQGSKSGCQGNCRGMRKKFCCAGGKNGQARSERGVQSKAAMS